MSWRVPACVACRSARKRHFYDRLNVCGATMEDGVEDAPPVEPDLADGLDLELGKVSCMGATGLPHETGAAPG